MKTGNFIVQGIGIVAVVDNILRGQLNGRSNAIDCKSFSGISAGNAIFGVEVCRGDNIGCIVVVFIRSTCDYLSPGNGNLLPGGQRLQLCLNSIAADRERGFSNTVIVIAIRSGLSIAPWAWRAPSSTL